MLNKQEQAQILELAKQYAMAHSEATLARHRKKMGLPYDKNDLAANKIKVKRDELEDCLKEVG
jgi:hypothetical protein